MATSAAAVVARARRNVIKHLMAANAVSAENAVSYAPPWRLERRQLARLTRSGVFHETRPGSYWIDIPAYAEWQARLRRRILFVVLGIAVLLGAVVMLVPR